MRISRIEYLVVLRNIINSTYSRIPPETKHNANEYLISAHGEKLMLRFIYDYMSEELQSIKGKTNEMNLFKCYYHIDNFAQRFFIFRENVFLFLKNIFQLKPKLEKYDSIETNQKQEDEKAKIRKILKCECPDVSNLIEEFFNKPTVKEIEEKRRKIVHRRGSEMIAYLDSLPVSVSHDSECDMYKNLVYFVNVNKQNANKELEKMKKVLDIVNTFFEKLIMIVNNYIK